MDEQMEAGQSDIAQEQGNSNQEQGVSTKEQEVPAQESEGSAMDASTQGSASEGAAGDQEVAPLKELGASGVNNTMDETAANPPGMGIGLPGGELNMDSLMDVPVTLSVEIGRKRMPINQLVNLSPGAIVDLNRDLDAPLDLLVNGTLIARGEVVVMGKKFGLRLVDICSPNERTRGLV